MTHRSTTAKNRLRSKIEPCREFIAEMRSRGATYAEITGELKSRFNVEVSVPRVCQFTRRAGVTPRPEPTLRAAVVRLRGEGKTGAEIAVTLRREHGVTATRESVMAMIRGNPFQSKLEPHRDLVFRLWRRRWTYAGIAAELFNRHGLHVSLATIYNFIKVRLPRPYPLSCAAQRSAQKTLSFAAR